MTYGKESQKEDRGNLNSVGGKFLCKKEYCPIWRQWQFPVHPEVLEILEIRNVQDAEPTQPERQAFLSEVSAHMELLRTQTATGQGYLAMAT